MGGGRCETIFHRETARFTTININRAETPHREARMPEPEKKKAELKITGMTCATCAVNIEDSLSQVKDVTKAQVNFGTEKAHVEFDPAKVTLGKRSRPLSGRCPALLRSR
jgi:copper chaperone CopZ